MARRNRGGGGGDEGGSWMDTYGDLVTLLLTFFVLLYSMSSLDQSKWELFVKSIYPGMEDSDGEAAEKIILNGKASSSSSAANTVLGQSAPMNDVSDLDVNQLYITLAQQMDNQGVSGVSVSRGTDYTFVEFKDNVFFEGDSSTISAEGQKALDVFCDTLAPYADLISQIDIMGHTASSPGENNIRSDRMLAAMRAAEDYQTETFAIAGGVAANSALRGAMKEACEKRGIRFCYPSPVFCTDNAAMIGAAAYYDYIKGIRSGWDLNAVPNLKLGER